MTTGDNKVWKYTKEAGENEHIYEIGSDRRVKKNRRDGYISGC
jgi:hypothetical protein